MGETESLGQLEMFIHTTENNIKMYLIYLDGFKWLRVGANGGISNAVMNLRLP
jgi:hypothetical protein